MEQAAYKYFKKLDEMGGMVSAIEKGFPQREIKDAAYAYQKEIDNKDRIIVGVNEFITDEKSPLEVFKLDPATAKRQIERLKKVRMTRNKESLNKAMADLKKAATGKDNLMPFLIQAVKVHATLGEICDALKAVFGAYKEPLV